MNNTKHLEKPENFEGISLQEFYKFLTGFNPYDPVQFADPCDPYAVHTSKIGIWGERDMDDTYLLVSKLERSCKNIPAIWKEYSSHFARAREAYLDGDSVSFKQNIDEMLQEIKLGS